ncbi:MAG TPA: alpha/beta fold hydrolase [Bacilli bacterium]
MNNRPGENKKVCLLLHGYTGGPYELEPLAEALRRRGYETVMPTLPGHDQELRGLKTTKWYDWLRAAEREAATLTEAAGRFDLVGFSMGGVLAAYLSTRYPVRKLVLLNAAAIYFSPVRFVRHLTAAIRNGQVSQLLRGKKIPLGANWQFVNLVERLRPSFGHVAVPTFIAQSGRDQVVHPLSARYLQRRIKGPVTVCFYPESRHLICLDAEADRLFAQVAAFLLGNGED